ncbi:MAG: hypothetical protein QE274_05375 [Verrucomicrobiaceae bacterium]|jgi:hypothetical protein|nr:hypothetical protein [Verrucomicrobiaceae bacterium]
MNSHWHDLIQRHMAGLTIEDEAASLQELLKQDDNAARLYLRYTNLDLALESKASSMDATRELLTAPIISRSPRWTSWRPLTAAAAGIVFGMLCTSVVFGFVGQRQVEKKTPLAVVQPSFEDAQMPLAKGFPPAPSLWTGDVAKVVPAENGVTPKDGHHMLRMETTVYGKPVLFPRLYQIIALSPSGSERREIEVSASFASADPGSSPHYTVRAYAVNEAPERLGPDWFARHWFVQQDEAIASAETGFENPPGSTNWQSIGLRMQVPGKARCLVVFFGVKNQPKSQAKKPHYLDAVKVSFVESPSIP